MVSAEDVSKDDIVSLLKSTFIHILGVIAAGVIAIIVASAGTVTFGVFFSFLLLGVTTFIAGWADKESSRTGTRVLGILYAFLSIGAF